MSTDQLRTEKAKLETKLKRLGAQYDEARRRVDQIDKQLWILEKRELLAPLIGVRDGVKCSYRRAADEKNAWLNTERGTLTKIGRTRVYVDFGEHGQWNFPMRDIVPATERQGVTFAAMAAGDWGDLPDGR
jgi:hypothetical protein